MSAMASARFGIAPAPAGLALVQELLNTAPVATLPDLLDDQPGARAWLDGATALWAEQTEAEQPQVSLTHRDLAELRALRTRLHRVVSGDTTGDTPETLGALRLALTGAGELTATPEGSGARWVTSAVLGEMYRARQHDTWRRLKTCRNSACGTAFFDRSRNNGGVWHDVHVCGNAANLRASRARRKNREQV